MILDLIVPHYKEPWALGKPFFDMLACQRGVNFNDFRVILVHDGTDTFPNAYFTGYPYEVVQCPIQHGGVSAARNYGLRMSDAKWVAFCDFDDMFTTCYALYQIMQHFDRDVDYMWTMFFIECMGKNGLYFREKEQNVVWVHGKFFRRQWLIDNELFFPEGIHYSEDSAFCALVNEIAQPNRHGEIKTAFPLYVWTYRADSVSVDPLNKAKNITGFIDRNEYVVAEFKRRGIDHVNMVGRLFADAYWAFHQKNYKFPEEEQRFIEMSRKHLKDFEKVDRLIMTEILRSAAKAFTGIEMDMSENFYDWIRRIS